MLPPFDDVLADLGGWLETIAGEESRGSATCWLLLVERVVPQRISRGKYRAEI